MSGILHARYRMIADVYRQESYREPSGQWVRTWPETPFTEITCSARGILGAGIRVVGSTETWGEDYEDVEWVKLRTATTNLFDLDFSDEYLIRSHRIGNIRRKANGETLWRDENGNPEMFQIKGISPVFDPFDRIAEVDVLLKGITGD